MGFSTSGAQGSLSDTDDRSTLPNMVVDADGLKLLAKIDEWASLMPAPSVLTPHPGELAALTGLDKDEIQSNRTAIARRFAREWGHILVLKGAFTIIAAPDGRTALNPFATAALARAGTGDVLAGLITGFLAQGLEPYDAAVSGTYVHGLAGELAADSVGTEASVLAGDVLQLIPKAMAATIRRSEHPTI